MLMRAIRGTREMGNRTGMDEPPTKRQHIYRDEGVLDPEMQFIGKKLQLALLLNQNGECLLDKIPDNYKTVYEEDFPYGHELEEFVPSLKEYFKCSKESDGNWHVKAKHVPIDETKIIMKIIVKAYMGNSEDECSTSHSHNGDATFRNSNQQNPFESPVSICDGNLAGSIPSDLTSILDDIEGLRALLNCTENDHIEGLGSNLNDVQTQVIDLVPVAPSCNVEVTQRNYTNSFVTNDERMDENEWNNNGSSTSETIGNNPSIVYPIMSSNGTTTCVSQYPSMDRSSDPITRSENVDSVCCRNTEESSSSCSCTEPGFSDHPTHTSERSECMNAYSCSTLNGGMRNGFYLDGASRH